jgi:hypothetical protein
MADFLSEQRSAIDKRLKELKPLVDEYLKLEKAQEALESVVSPKRGPGRPRGSGRKAAGGTRRRRRRRGGTRADQALNAVRQTPGITVRELSEQLKIKHPNYLYRVMAGLEEDGAVKKQGRGYVAP